jgi:O-antigen/teichoic acid export membrane protein
VKTDVPLRGAFLQTVLGGLRTGGTYWMIVGSFLAAVGAYLFQVVTTRSLDEVRYAPIGTLWTIQYLTVSIVLYSVETYVTRTWLRARGGRRTGGSLARIWIWLAAVAVGVSLVCWWFSRRLFQGHEDLALVAGILVLSFGAFMIVRGQLAGSGRFKAYGLVTASESISRFAFATVAAVGAAGTRLFAWIMPLGALAAASWWPLLKRRRPEPVPETVAADTLTQPRRTGHFLVLTTAANASTQFLLAGGPLLLALMRADPAEISVFFVTVTAARLPLVFMFGGILSRLLRTFVRLADANEGRSLRKVAAWIAIGTAIAALLGGTLAAVIGPDVIALLFGQAFLPPWWVTAGATMGVVLGSGSMVLGQILIATGWERRLPGPWAIALIGSGVAIAVTPGSPLVRVVGGFIVGEVLALTGLAVAARLRRWSPSV